ncbi:MAG: electron transfer flavoprotein subunit alpha/FixB family protein [Planctomycetaceae bacterium]|jgi:electron transfer flavoprotein alpha subunit|nr:electron transfer flavoprotein subunit alpha/FixB family protein [Planctomycetaceae bacterium]
MIEKNTKGDVWVYAEVQDGTLQDVSLELLGKARKLADKLGVPAGAVLPKGTEISAAADTLIAHGADSVYLVEDTALADYRTEPYAHVLVELIKKYRPQIVLFGATPLGRDLAPRAASATRSGLTADCTDLDIADVTEKSGTVHPNLLLQVRPAFGGNIVATIVNYDQWPQMATVREGVMPLGTPQKSRKGNVIKETVPLTDQALFAVEVIKREVEKRKLNLKGAKVVVAGGAGMGSRDNFELLFDLAGALGGVVGASRAAIDSGFIGHEHQIGQTGTTVRPALYIACGISGAIQHRSGMEDSAKIIAVNTDREAPIFSIAHYGIVGDAKQVVPMLLRAFKERN